MGIIPLLSTRQMQEEWYGDSPTRYACIRQAHGSPGRARMPWGVRPCLRLHAASRRGGLHGACLHVARRRRGAHARCEYARTHGAAHPGTALSKADSGRAAWIQVPLENADK
eukprot:6182500-Pleurochrysis_carterae.AAC.1